MLQRFTDPLYVDLSINTVGDEASECSWLRIAAGESVPRGGVISALAQSRGRWLSRVSKWQYSPVISSSPRIHTARVLHWSTELRGRYSWLILTFLQTHWSHRVPDYRPAHFLKHGCGCRQQFYFSSVCSLASLLWRVENGIKVHEAHIERSLSLSALDHIMFV